MNEYTIPATLSLQDFQQMEQLELSCYDESYITPYREAYHWYKKEPRSVLVLTHGSRIIGFVNLFPVEEELFLAILRGHCNDSLLKAEDIAADTPTAKYLFLSCAVVDKAYRRQGLGKELIRRAAAQYAIAREALLITDNVTEAGCRLSESLGLLYQRDSDHGTKIYMGAFPVL